jgi:uncharacterized protein (DUF488 family)
VGYEGRDIDSFVTDLLADGVSRVVDVRMTPLSRKPGFSKTRLANTLADAGIRYEHRRELGNPKPNRAGFGGTPDELQAARDAFIALLANPHAHGAIDALAKAAERERVALLCFEADQQRCHRDVVMDEVARRTTAASGSRPRAR